MRLVFLFFIATIAYVFWHLWRITPGGWWLKLAAGLLFLLWMAAAFGSIMLRERGSVAGLRVLNGIGQPWTIVYVYLLIAFVLADLGVLLRLLPKGWLNGNGYALAGILGVIALLMLVGNVHYRHKYREEMTVHTSKPLTRPLTIVFASDLHLGYTNSRREFARWVDLIRDEHPDLVLFGGDIIDNSVRPLLQDRYGEEFARIGAPLFTVLGNHEYISSEGDAEKFFADAGITLLRDSTACFEGLRIIGRDDRSNPARLPLERVMEACCGAAAGCAAGASLAGGQAEAAASGAPECAGATVAGGAVSCSAGATVADGAPGRAGAYLAGGAPFTILLDHQPAHLEEAERAGIDFQFSGHTHRGQFWPVSWLTDAIYEKSWGRHRRGNTLSYVSSGLGIWGPKVRLGSRSEYLVLHLLPAD